MSKRVFFSFHYQDVADFRANVVRQHWVTKLDREEAGFFDASLWERTRKTGDESIKRLIDSGLSGTSATAVLIGTETYSRRWVRYEILKSIAKGNALIGININQVPCKDKFTKSNGPSPFEYLAVKYNERGDRVDPYEWDGTKWGLSRDVTGWSLSNPNLQNAGQTKKLSNFYKNYCWIADGGYQSFSSWIGA